MPMHPKTTPTAGKTSMNGQTNGSKSQFSAGLAIGLMLLVGVAGGAFAMGVHMGDNSIHEAAANKTARIHTIIDREIKPQLNRIEADIREIDLKLRDADLGHQTK